jgi:hypothetical protein
VIRVEDLGGESTQKRVENTRSREENSRNEQKMIEMSSRSTVVGVILEWKTKSDVYRIAKRRKVGIQDRTSDELRSGRLRRCGRRTNRREGKWQEKQKSNKNTGN